MRNLVFFISLFVFALMPCYGQATGTWRDLVLNVTTPEDAVRVFGAASKDQPNQKLPVNSSRGAEWLNFSDQDKIFRKMIFQKPDGFAEAKLFFKNDKLVAIELKPKYKWQEGWLDPDDLGTIFKADFKPHNAIFGGKPLGTPQEFAEFGDPTTKDGIRAFYEMIAVSDDTFIFATVDNREPVNASLLGGSSGRRESKAKAKRDRSGEFAGHVNSVQIFSRTLSK